MTILKEQHLQVEDSTKMEWFRESEDPQLTIKASKKSSS